MKANGLPVINGIVAGVAASLMGTTTVGNFVEVLKRTLTQNAVDFTKEDLNRVHPHKRQHIIPMYAREENNQPNSPIPQVITRPTAAKTILIKEAPINWEI